MSLDQNQLPLQSIDLHEQNFSFFGPGSQIKGEFHLVGIIKVASDIEGTVSVANGGHFTLERDGHFTGTLFCDDIEIFGDFNGQIECNGRLVLQSSAKVNGKINTKTLSIFPGAILNVESHTN